MGTRPWGLLAALAILAGIAIAIHAWMHGASSFQPAAGLPTPFGGSLIRTKIHQEGNNNSRAGVVVAFLLNYLPFWEGDGH